MKSILFRVLLASTFSIVFVSPVLAADANRVLARVNGDNITEKDLRDTIKALPESFQQWPEAKLRPVVLDQMINSKLITADAAKKKMIDDPLVGRKMELAKDQVIQEVYLTHEIKDKINESAVKEEYKKYLKANPKQDEIFARHMLVDNENDAKALIAKLDKGEDFATLAKTNNKGPEKEKGGELGWFTKDDMVKEFSDAAFDLKKGQYSKQPVKSPFGWHVIKVEDRRARAQPKFEDVKDQLAIQLSQRLIKEKVDALRKANKVEIYDEAPKDQTVAPDTKDKDDDNDK